VTRRSSSVPLASLAFIALGAISVGAQSVTVTRVADAIVVRAPAFAFIKGDPLVRLKEGRSVRVDLDLSVLPRPGAAAATQVRQGFVLSYDLWEERFAVTRVGPPSTAAAYLTSAAAEAWCLEQLMVPVAALGNLGRDTPFWIRLEYRVLDGDTTSERSDTAGFTLRTLIDALSARRQATAWTDATEAGPFRLQP
jgi:hypothetical protein